MFSSNSKTKVKFETCHSVNDAEESSETLIRMLSNSSSLGSGRVNETCYSLSLNNCIGMRLSQVSK